MKPSSHPEQLLEDVLAEGVTPEFRARLLEETLQQVRHRRSGRRRRHALVAVAICLSAVFLALKARQPDGHSSSAQLTSPQAQPAWLVSSQPLPVSMVVESSAASVEAATSTPGALAIVETPVGKKSFRDIDDPELLAMLAGRPVALVRQPGQPAEILFLDPADQDGFPVP